MEIKQVINAMPSQQQWLHIKQFNSNLQQTFRSGPAS